jgi:hypothetical protein
MRRQSITLIMSAILGLGVFASSTLAENAAATKIGRYIRVLKRPNFPNDPRSVFKKPDVARLCDLYLQNLNSYASNGISHASFRSIAPHLTNQIRILEWENLDVDEFSALFKEAVSVAVHGGSRPASEQDISDARRLLNKGSWVFRRINKPIVGRVIGVASVNGTYRDVPVPSTPVSHYLVQMGDNPDLGSDDVNKHLFQVPLKLDSVYSEIGTEYWSFIGSSLIRIHSRLYLLGKNHEGDIELQEFLTDYPTMVETVCYFQFKSISKSRN